MSVFLPRNELRIASDVDEGSISRNTEIRGTRRFRHHAFQHRNGIGRDLERFEIETHRSQRAPNTIDDVTASHVARVAAAGDENTDVSVYQGQQRDLSALDRIPHDREEYGLTAGEDLGP